VLSPGFDDAAGPVAGGLSTTLSFEFEQPDVAQQ
jgi:hypothetical protein